MQDTHDLTYSIEGDIRENKTILREEVANRRPDGVAGRHQEQFNIWLQGRKSIARGGDVERAAQPAARRGAGRLESDGLNLWHATACNLNAIVSLAALARPAPEIDRLGQH